MKIALISPYSNIPAFGLRSLSACLKKEGHDVRLIFLPQKYSVRYEEKILNEVVELIKGFALIGISLMANHFDNAVQITQKLKQNVNTPIIWGGIHATLRPDECLNYADMVCIGEGEETLLELSGKMEDGRDYLDTQGIWFKNKEGIIKNKLRPLVQDLDVIPFQDYEYENHYILSNNSIHKMDEHFLNMFLRGDYLAQPTRGCPFECTYCCNNALVKMYPNQKSRLRKRGVDSLIQELVAIKSKLPFVNHITFDDDAFFSYTEEEISDFCEKYKHTICLPLDIGGATPTTLTRKKLSLLIDAGLTGLRMGIQTGCERTKKLYKRHHSNRQVEETVKIINEFKNKITPRYDIIINNPWETDEDLAETLMFFTKIPKPYMLNIFSLTFYPGTELYNKAVEDGIITNDLEEVYRKSYNIYSDGTSGKLLNETYFNNLFYLLYVYSLAGYDISPKTMFLLTNRKVNPLRSRTLYSMLVFRASFLLKKKLVFKLFAFIKEGDLNKIETWFHDEYSRD